MRRTRIIYGTAAAVLIAVLGLLVWEAKPWGEAAPMAATAMTGQELAITCEIDLDDHPTRDEVIAILGEPVDVDHDEGEDNLDGSEWLPAEDTLVWANGNQVSFDADTNRASSWMMDDPRVC